MVEGARLESVFRGNSNVGSNPTLSASLPAWAGSARLGSTPTTGGLSFARSSSSKALRLVRALVRGSDLIAVELKRRI